jgi:hypothetical protein
MTIPETIQLLAEASHLDVEDFAQAILDAQPGPELPADEQALSERLVAAMSNDLDREQVDREAAGKKFDALLQARIAEGDSVAESLGNHLGAHYGAKFLRLAVVLDGNGDKLRATPEEIVCRERRHDLIAASIGKLTGWTSFESGLVDDVYAWLWPDEVAYYAGFDVREQAIERFRKDPSRRPTELLDLDVGTLRNDIRLTEEAAEYCLQQAEAHQRVIEVLDPYFKAEGPDSTVGNALRKAAVVEGLDPNIDPEELLRRVIEASDAS